MEGYFDRPNAFIHRAAAFFGIGRLDFDQTEGDERRLIYASALPLLVIVGDIALIMLQLFKSTPYDTDYTTWWWSYVFITTVQGPLLPAAIVGLVLFSIYPVNRPQASFAFVLTLLLLLVGTALGLLSAILRVVIQNPASEKTWLASIWQAFAYDLCFLAIGYAFLAYRGLSTQDYGRRVYGQRRRRFTREHPPNGE